MEAKEKRITFPHVKQKGHRAGVYGSHRNNGIPQTVVDFLGEPTEIVQAIDMPEAKLEWIGGGDDGCTLDVSLMISSRREDHSPYRMTAKLGKRHEYYRSAPKNELEIISLYHSCPELEWKNITRLPGKCHHMINGRMFLEENLPEICEENIDNVPGVFYLRPIYRFYPSKKYMIHNFILMYSDVAVRDYSEIFKERNASAVDKRNKWYKLIHRKLELGNPYVRLVDKELDIEDFF